MKVANAKVKGFQKVAKPQVQVDVKKDFEEIDKLSADESLPSITTFGICRSQGGWIFTKLITQGNSVVLREDTDPTLKSLCWEKYKIESAKQFLQVD